MYPIGPGWTAWFAAIAPRVGSLNRDLLLATVPSGVGQLEFDPYSDLPVWERIPETERPEGINDETWESLSPKNLREIRRQPRGPADVLTWQSRRIRLIVEGDSVTGLVLAAGDPLDPPNRYPVEPRSSWRYSNPKSTKSQTVYMPKEAKESNSLWRGIEALFPQSVATQRPNKTTEVVSFYGPAISSWLADLGEAEALGDEDLSKVTFETIGMILGSMMSVVDDIITDSLTLPVALLREENVRYRVEVHDWITRAESVSRAVAGFAADLGRAAGSDTTDGLFEEARGRFLAAAQPEFLAALAALRVGEWEETKQLGQEWSTALHTLALRQRSDLLRDIGDAAIVGHESGGRYLTAGSAERQLRRRLANILEIPGHSSENLRREEGTVKEKVDA